MIFFFQKIRGANGQLLFGIDDGSGGEFFEDIDFPALLKGSVDQEIELCESVFINCKYCQQLFLQAKHV